MALLDLLKDPDAYKFNSKQRNYLPNTTGGYGPLLGRRVTFDVTNENANPSFEHGIDHFSSNSEDIFARGGMQVGDDRRQLDADRISEFFKTPIGERFIAKQVTLQTLNKTPQFLYNLGLNTLQSARLAGLSNVQRGGILSVGGFDVAEALGTQVDYLSLKKFDKEDVQTDEKGNILQQLGSIFKGGKGGLLKENNYNLGDPGKKASINNFKDLVKSINPFAADEGYDVKISSKIDKLNALPIMKDTDDTPALTQELERAARDFVPFRFEVRTYDEKPNHIIAFRAFLDSLDDSYNASHNEIKYNGRGEKFYTYDSFDRKISLGFKIAAQSRHEMKPLYQKLNYLAAQTAPNYSETSGRIRTPYTYLTLGNWFNRLPGLITQVGLKWSKEYPWEIALDKNNGEGKDKDMFILPHVLDVSVSFQPIHTFTPRNSISAPFLGIDGGAGDPLNWIEEASNKVPSINDAEESNKFLDKLAKGIGNLRQD